MPSMPSRGQGNQTQLTVPIEPVEAFQIFEPQCAEIFRDPGFWEAAKYGIPSDLLPLLAKDQAANAAVALGPEGTSENVHVAFGQS